MIKKNCMVFHTINFLSRGNFWCLKFSSLLLHDFQWLWNISEILQTTIKTFFVFFRGTITIYPLNYLDTCCTICNWKKEFIIHSKNDSRTGKNIYDGVFNCMCIMVEKYCNEIESIINFDSMIYIKSLCHLECSWCYLYIPRHEYYSRHERNKLHVTGNAPNT